MEKGWSPWFPGNEPYYGETDAPVKYTLGRYDFEALMLVLSKTAVFFGC